MNLSNIFKSENNSTTYLSYNTLFAHNKIVHIASCKLVYSKIRSVLFTLNIGNTAFTGINHLENQPNNDNENIFRNFAHR